LGAEGEETMHVMKRARPPSLDDVTSSMRNDAKSKRYMDAYEIELIEDDNFKAHIFQNKVYMGTGAFHLVELSGMTGCDEVFGSVLVLCASSSKLMRALEQHFEEADGLAHFCRNKRCSYEEPGLSVIHLCAYERLATLSLDRSTKGDTIEMSHLHGGRTSVLVKAGSAGSSRDRRGRDQTSGGPVSRGPADSERSMTDAFKTAEELTPGSSLASKVLVLRQCLKDSKMTRPQEISHYPCDFRRRDEVERLDLASHGGVWQDSVKPPPMTGSSVIRVLTPGCRSMEVSQVLVVRAVEKELDHRTRLPLPRRLEGSRSPLSRDHSSSTPVTFVLP
jgi:hypothetical protein